MSQAIDEGAELKYGIVGRIVTMDDAGVIDRGVMYVDRGVIADVRPTGAAVPPGFEDAKRIETDGTIYPGLIELHNHLPYNVLQLWQVPKLFQRREQWRDHEDKRRLVTTPMRVLGEAEGYIEAVIRYVECKCLVAGVTTSQGITLFSAAGSTRLYRGVVRNVEQTDDPRLPEARTRIADVEAEDVERFFESLSSNTCLLLHLSEGVGDRARQHFQRLQLPSGSWAITSALAGIHGLGLQPEDLTIYGEHDGAIVWSPLSNMLLYGRTLDLARVKDAGIRLGLGSDWSPTGSKNLLGEIKIALLVNQDQGNVYSEHELVNMATQGAAEILGWGEALGSLRAGKSADFIVVDGAAGDPFGHLLKAPESALSLVVVHGVPRCGSAVLMQAFALPTEPLAVGGVSKGLYLQQQEADPLVGGLTLAEATARLRGGLSRLHELGTRMEARGRMLAADRPLPEAAPTPTWSLLLDNDESHPAIAGRTLTALGRELSTPGGAARGAALHLADLALDTEETEIMLDALTVADDVTYVDRLAAQMNLPAFVKDGLRDLHAQPAAKTTPTFAPMGAVAGGAFARWLDQAYRDRALDEILAASPGALFGVSSADAERLRSAFQIDSIRELAQSRVLGNAQALLAAAGVPHYDPGPPAEWESIFGAAPLAHYVDHSSGRFRTEFGPVFYRGRLDGTARVLLIGQDPSTDELLAHRAFVGQSGQRVQGLLRKLGITRSYVLVNTFLFGVRGQFDSVLTALSLELPILEYRNRILDTMTASNVLETVIAIGAGARHAVQHWPGRSAYRVFELVHPSAPETLVVESWNSQLPALREALTADEPNIVDATPYGQQFASADEIAIPRFDLPFGLPDWHGSGGTRSGRDGDDTILWRSA